MGQSTCGLKRKRGDARGQSHRVYPNAGLVPNSFTGPRWAVSLTLTARARTLNQTMPIGISPVGDQAPAYGAVPIEQRRIRTLHQVPCQRAGAVRRIEPTLRLHDYAPVQALAGFGVEPRHDPIRTTRWPSHPNGGVVLPAEPAHAR